MGHLELAVPYRSINLSLSLVYILYIYIYMLHMIEKFRKRGGGERESARNIWYMRVYIHAYIYIIYRIRFFSANDLIFLFLPNGHGI